jgi:hypothetical protein
MTQREHFFGIFLARAIYTDEVLLVENSVNYCWERAMSRMRIFARVVAPALPF